MEESSSIAFVASWAYSIPLRFPSLQESVDTIHSTDLELLSQSLAYHLIKLSFFVLTFVSIFE